MDDEKCLSALLESSHVVEEDKENERLKEDLIILNNGLASFHDALLPKLKSLTCLDVSKSNISQLPEALCDLASLQIFNASCNFLSSLPTNIGNLEGLVKLILSNNKIPQLPTSFAKLKILEVLDISYNQFDTPPECLQSGCAQINYLNISHNQLKEWKVAPLCGYGLQVFNCAHNQLQSNPSWLWGDFCHSLEDLDLSFNTFVNPAYMVRPYTIWRTGVTVQLKNLYLCNCGINTNNIELLYQLKALKKLNVGNRKKADVILNTRESSSSNFIWQLSLKPFQSQSVLTELFLCGVGLSCLPDDIICLEVLEILDCQENELQWLPDTFSKLNRLRVAIFSNNKLLYLPQDLGDLSELEELWLDCNMLEGLPSTTSNLKSLKWLDLYSNYLETFPSCLKTLLASLSGLDIDHNFFEPMSAMNEDADYFQNFYKTLRQKMRQHPQMGVVRNCCRMNGVQFRMSENEQESYSESEYGSCHSVEETGGCGISEETENSSEENWDLHDSDDDYFDPTFYIPLKMDAASRKRVLIIHESVIGPNSFCPSDIHPSPTVKPGKDPLASDEGQFEDA